METPPDFIHYYFPTRLCIAWDILSRIGEETQSIASRAVIVSLQSELVDPDRVLLIKEQLDKYGKGAIIYDELHQRPGADDLDTLVYFIKQTHADAILAYGGRETMFAARSAALLSANNVFAADLHSLTLPLAKAPLPCISIAAGPLMGEEFAPSVCVYDPEERQSFYKQNQQLFPQTAFIDPLLSQDLSQPEMIKMSLAILSTAIEAVISKHANDIVISHGMHAIDLIIRNLTQYIKDNTNKTILQNICLASVFAGIASANSGRGLAYSLASAMYNLIGSDFYSTFNVILPHTMEYNITTRADLYVHIAKSLGDDITDLTVIEAAIKAIETIRKLAIELKVPKRLSEFNINEIQLNGVAKQAAAMEMLHNNPRDIDEDGIEKVLLTAY